MLCFCFCFIFLSLVYPMSSIVDYPFSILQSLLVKRYGISVLQMTTDLLLRNICFTNDHGFVVMEYLCYKLTRICCCGISVLQMTTNLSPSFVIITIRPCLHSWLITGFTTKVKVARWMPLMYQELFTLQEHLCSRQAFSRVRK